jgi:hypothetical protein
MRALCADATSWLGVLSFSPKEGDFCNQSKRAASHPLTLRPLSPGCPLGLVQCMPAQLHKHGPSAQPSLWLPHPATFDSLLWPPPNEMADCTAERLPCRATKRISALSAMLLAVCQFGALSALLRNALLHAGLAVVSATLFFAALGSHHLEPFFHTLAAALIAAQKQQLAHAPTTTCWPPKHPPPPPAAIPTSPPPATTFCATHSQGPTHTP